MERLTTPWMDGTFDTFDPIDIVDNEYSKINYERVLNKLGAYEDAEEQGLLLRPKVALNSFVYMESEYWGIIPYKVCDISYGMCGFVYTVCAFRFDELLDDNEVVDDDFGKIVLTTKEEAEKKLDSMKGE